MNTKEDRKNNIKSFVIKVALRNTTKTHKNLQSRLIKPNNNHEKSLKQIIPNENINLLNLTTLPTIPLDESILIYKNDLPPKTERLYESVKCLKDISKNKNKKNIITKSRKNTNNKIIKTLKSKIPFNKVDKNTINDQQIKKTKQKLTSLHIFKNAINKKQTTRYKFSSKDTSISSNIQPKKATKSFCNNPIFSRHCTKFTKINRSSYYLEKEKEKLNKSVDNQFKRIPYKKIIKPRKNNSVMDGNVLRNKSIRIINNPLTSLSNISKKKIDIPKLAEKISLIKNNYISMITSQEIIYNKNPQIVDEYIDDIYLHLKSIENIDLPKKNYMINIQDDITEYMRTILLDWLIDVHMKYKLLPETLFVAINLIDRYLSKKKINREYYQLLGTTCMFIASKYEEIYPPNIKEFIKVTANSYTKEQLLKMEYKVLSTLEFNITYPSYLRFLEVYNYYINMDDMDFFRCKFFVELALLDYKLCHFPPSLIAAVCLILNLKIKKKSKLFFEENKKYDEKKIYEITKYTCEDIDKCLNELINELIVILKPNYEYNALVRKYSKDSFMKVTENISEILEIKNMSHRFINENSK